MLRIRLPSVAATATLAIALAAPAALGQPAPSTPPRPNAGSAPAPPVEMGRPQRARGGWRSSRIVGAIVYNDRDERIGTVDDLIVGHDGKVSEAVLSVGGLLSIGAKLVAVPYSQLRFEANTEEGQTTDVGAPPAARVTPPAAPGVPAAGPPPVRPVVTTRVVLPGATRDSLAALPGFNYRDKD